MSQIEQVSQSLSTDEIVHLYTFDASSIGGDTYYFTSSAFSSSPIVWQGNSYTPIDMESEGWEWNGRGTLPMPKIRVSNVNSMFSALVIAYKDLLGCVVTRTRTFRQFLDGEENADPTAYYPLDVFKIERKTSQTKETIEFELSSSLDQEGRMIPGRQVIQGICTHRYRVWNGSAFSYANATCPYVSANYFDEKGVATSASGDKCGKKLSDCVLRFGESPLPTRAFPGVSRARSA